MKYEDYNDPIYTVWSLDENGNYRPVKVTNNERLVRYGMCIMKHIPDEGYGVSIDGMVEVKDKEELAKDEFQVDYTYGLIRFNPSIDKREIVLKEYWAKGNYYYPAHRLYWTIDELTGRVTTVHDVIQYIIDYYEGTKKQIQQMIDDFRKELADEWQKLLDKFAEFERVFNKAELTKVELEKLLVESLSTYQDLTNIVDVAKKMDYFTGVAKKTKVTIDNTEFPLIISKEGNELGLIKQGLQVDNMFRYSEMVIKFKANENVEDPIIYNYKTKEFIKVNINMKQGDMISIATSFYKNKASLYTIDETKQKIIDITDKLETNTSYFYLSVGNNTFFIDSKKGFENLEANIFFNGKNLENEGKILISSDSKKLGGMLPESFVTKNELNNLGDKIDKDIQNIKFPVKTVNGQTGDIKLIDYLIPSGRSSVGVKLRTILDDEENKSYTIYVDEKNGSDNNTGTLENPLKTFIEAFKRIPVIYTNNYTIHLLSNITLTEKNICFCNHLMSNNANISIESEDGVVIQNPDSISALIFDGFPCLNINKVSFSNIEIRARYNTYLSIKACNLTGGKYTISSHSGAYIDIRGSKINDSTEACLSTSFGGNIFSNKNIYVSQKYGLKSRDGGVIYDVDSNISALVGKTITTNLGKIEGV